MQQNKTASQRKTINPACWVPTAYFAMGLPFIAINLVSVFMFKDLGISDTQIAFWTSLIMMPWTLKFLWSPFLEMYRTKKLGKLFLIFLSLKRQGEGQRGNVRTTLRSAKLMSQARAIQ